jgi:hypothetical protein
MSHFLLLTVLVFGAEPRAAAASSDRGRKEAPPAAAKPGDAEVRRLVEQLGAESYAQREAASKGLADLGERALPALRAAKNSPDPEVRRRVARLLRPLEARARIREIEAIKKSIDSPHEKGRKLKELITIGMEEDEVERLLGKYEGLGIMGRQFSQELLLEYKKYGLRMTLSKTRTPSGWTSYRVIEVELIRDRRGETRPIGPPKVERR